MAGYDDDFQGYSIGSVVPFGSWILDPSAFTADIKAGGSGIPGTDRYLEVFLGAVAVNPVTTGYQTSFTQYSALKLLATLPFGGANFSWSNGPNGGGLTFTLLTIKVEADGTISAYDTNGGLLKNSKDAWFNFFAWNFFQQNVTFSDVTVLGVDYVNIDYELILNGTSVLSFTITTTVAVSGLTHGTAEVNRFQLLGGHHAAYTLTTPQAPATYPHAGTPAARIYQAPIEVDELPNDAAIDVIQAAIEVDELPNTAAVEVAQCVIEVDLRIRNRWYISES